MFSVAAFDLTALLVGLADGGGVLSAWISLLAQDAAPEEPGFFVRMLSNPMVFFAGLLMIFYFTFLAPERRRKAAEAQLMSSLKKNDRVVTVGGIHATVVAAAPDSDVVTLRIDENGNTRIKVNRSAIASVVNVNKDASANKDAKDSKVLKDSESDPDPQD